MSNFVTYIKTNINNVDEIKTFDSYCNSYITSLDGNILYEFKDFENEKKKLSQYLKDAIDYCKDFECTLIIAKLDLLVINVEFVNLILHTEIDIYFCDMPNVGYNTLKTIAPLVKYLQKIKGEKTLQGINQRIARGEQTGGTAELWCKNSNLTDHEKELYRSEVAYRAGIESGANRTQNALRNPNNTAFKYFIQDWVQTHGEINKATKWSIMVLELNKQDLTTATGMEYNEVRARAMHRKIKKIYK